jgi:hypothetical protein
VLRRARWDEDSESWILEKLADQQQHAAADQSAAAPGDGSPWGRRPVAAPGARRPVSALARAAVAAGDMNPRFRSENILAMELDMPDRVTFDYVEGGGPQDPRLQAALDAVLRPERHAFLVFAAPGAAGPLQLGAPQVVPAGAYGAAGGGGAAAAGGRPGSGGGGARAVAAALQQRPASASRGGRAAEQRRTGGY